LVAASCLAGAAPAHASYYVYTLDDRGKLSEYFGGASGLTGPTLQDDFGSSVGSHLAVSPNGKGVYVSDSVDDRVLEYDIGAGGSLTAKSVENPLTGARPAGIAFSPDTKHAYIADSGDNTVSQYDVDASGVLKPKSPPAVSAGVAPYGLAVSPDGKSVYVVNSGGEFTISQYNLDASGALSPKKPAAVATGLHPREIAISPDGTSAYVTGCADAISCNDGIVSAYTIGSSGNLAPAKPATIAAQFAPAGIAVSRDGHSVYVANSGDIGTISQYTVDPHGALTDKTPATVFTTGSPGALTLAVGPDASTVYVADGSDLAQFGIGATGTLTLEFGYGNEAAGLAISPPVPCRVFAGCLAEVQPTGSGAVITTRLVAAERVGILVERIIDHKLVRVGRVPLGKHHKGRLRIPWNLRVNGHKLHKGRYLTTVRALDNHQHVIAIADPVRIILK
jgi:DNA-binding beta-propeller fold protein YncE